MPARDLIVWLGDVTGQLAEADPERVGRQVALLRVGIGAVGLLAARPAAHAAFRSGQVSGATVLALRAAASRDLVLGLGAVLAARRGPERLRGWLEAGALADAGDAMLLRGAPSVRRWARTLVVLSSGSAAALQIVLARKLTADRDPAIGAPLPD